MAISFYSVVLWLQCLAVVHTFIPKWSYYDWYWYVADYEKTEIDPERYTSPLPTRVNGTREDVPSPLETPDFRLEEKPYYRWQTLPPTPTPDELALLVGYQFIKAFHRNPLPWVKYATEWGWFHCVSSTWAPLGLDQGMNMHRAVEGNSWVYDGLIVHAFIPKWAYYDWYWYVADYEKTDIDPERYTSPLPKRVNGTREDVPSPLDTPDYRLEEKPYYRYHDVQEIEGFGHVCCADEKTCTNYSYVNGVDIEEKKTFSTEWGWFHCVSSTWAPLGLDQGMNMHRTFEGSSWLYDGLIGMNSLSMKLRTIDMVHYFIVLDTHSVLEFFYDSYMGYHKWEFLDYRFEDTKGWTLECKNPENLYWNWEFGEPLLELGSDLPNY
ncbi:unnamed protein product [Diatraea saccharalis]|uniref:Uncharacterized protein n=1 Tax=Diatraea saccharalis TaxID=40085 RepID=A0A9N9RCG7_9NEOP|nr:unnamed protein product [Diatraea saccharalis]